tara:strand:+ start:103 stop:417 length:315 start_codon:yes stop_codon:yes gene_type:complete
MSVSILDAILAINPDAQVSIKNDPFSDPPVVDEITWHDGTTPISDINIAAKKAQLETEYEAKKYQRDRKEEYPTIEDQLDDIYHNGIDGWKATIKAVKDKYPKE